MSLAALVTWRHHSLPPLPSQVPRMVAELQGQLFFFSNIPLALNLGPRHPPPPPANVSTTDAAIQFLRRARQIASLSCYYDTFLLGKKVDPKSAVVSPGVKAVLHLQQITPPPPRSLATEPSFRDRLMEVRSAPTRCTRRESANRFLCVPFTGKSSHFFSL